MTSNQQQLSEFICDNLLDVKEEVPWQADFRGSALPACQRQLMLSEFYRGEINTPRMFTQSYHFEVGRSIHRLVQNTWAKQSLLWGDWKCSDHENCGAFFQNTILEKGVCRRCGSAAEYVEKTIRDEESGFSGHCDGVVWCPSMKGYLVVELKSRNHNIIKDHEGKEPYESDIYQSSAYATLVFRQFKMPIIGRLVLWVGKPKPKPFLFWYYPGLGEDLFDAQVKERKDSLALVRDGNVKKVPGRCRFTADIGSCPFGGICFSHKRDELILEKYEEWKLTR